MIEAVGLRKDFEDGTLAVRDATFRVEPGEVLALLGPNGAGKTTTLHMLLGLLTPTSGAAFLCGIDVTKDRASAYRRVGYLSENVLLYGNLTAWQNMRFFADVSGATVPESQMRDLLERVGMLYARDRRVRTFSKGMRQRLGLAIALLKDPGALILDEPTTGLDPDGADALTSIIRGLRDEKRAVLMSTHDLDRVTEAADRVAVMGRGTVVATRASADIEHDVRGFYRLHAGGAP